MRLPFWKTAASVVMVATVIVTVSSGVALSKDKRTVDLRNGDIVFQRSPSTLGAALEIALESKVTHCGVVLFDNDTAYVCEAVGPVRRVPFDRWITIGIDSLYGVRRLKNAEKMLTDEKLHRMLGVFRSLEGRQYDFFFQWSDSMVYCSELVYKMFERGAGIEVGEIDRFGDFNLENDTVQNFMNSIYTEPPNLDEPVITPVSIYRDTTMVTVFTNLRE